MYDLQSAHRAYLNASEAFPWEFLRDAREREVLQARADACVAISTSG